MKKKILYTTSHSYLQLVERKGEKERGEKGGKTRGKGSKTLKKDQSNVRNAGKTRRGEEEKKSLKKEDFNEGKMGDIYMEDRTHDLNNQQIIGATDTQTKI